jgi:hypothetical protein
MYCWMRVMCHKSDTSLQLQELVRQCEQSLTSNAVQRVCSDHGGEFLAKSLQAFYRKTGTLHETTVGYAPPQNGAAERLVRSITGLGRTMHHDAALPSSQWGMSMYSPCYVHNRMPHAGTGKKTPHELLFGKKPDLIKLRVYGSPAYAVVPPEKLRKTGAGAFHAQWGRYMGEGPDGSCLKPEGSHKCVQHKTVHVVESDAPLHAGMWAQQAADAAAEHVADP